MNLFATTMLRTIPTAFILVIVALLIVAFGEPFHARVTFFFFSNLVIVLGLQIFMGNSNVANLGHFAFSGIAGYAVALLVTPVALKQTLVPGAPWGIAQIEFAVVPAIVIAVGIAVFAAWISGLAITRISGVAATISTLALLVIVHVVLVNWVDLTRGPRAFYGIPVSFTLPFAVAAGIVAVFIAKYFRESPDGIQLRATGDNLLAAKAMGADVRQLRLKAWVLGSALCAFGGVMFTLFNGTISPNSFYFNQTFLTISMLILGGMRSVSGAITGALVVSVGFEVFRALENGPTILGVELPEAFGLTGFFLGAVIVLSLTLRPKGLMGDAEWEDLWRQLKTARRSG